MSRFLLGVKYGAKAEQKHVPIRPVAGRIGSSSGSLCLQEGAMEGLSKKELSESIKKFIKEQKWICAKTYAKTWPHEYIVKEKVDNQMFNEFVYFIDENEYEEYFYEMKLIYFNYNDFTYWHMDNIINRCETSNIYLQRNKEDDDLGERTRIFDRGTASRYERV